MNNDMLRLRLPLSEFEEIETAVNTTRRMLDSMNDDGESVYSIAIDYWDQEAGDDYSIKVECITDGHINVEIYITDEDEAFDMIVEGDELICSSAIIDAQSENDLVREISVAATATLIAQLREKVPS